MRLKSARLSAFLRLTSNVQRLYYPINPSPKLGEGPRSGGEVCVERLTSNVLRLQYPKRSTVDRRPSSLFCSRVLKKIPVRFFGKGLKVLNALKVPKVPKVPKVLSGPSSPVGSASVEYQGYQGLQGLQGSQGFQVGQPFISLVIPATLVTLVPSYIPPQGRDIGGERSVGKPLAIS